MTQHNNTTAKEDEEIVYIIRRYTHDRSESGYDDIMGACGDPCYQCKKDEKMLNAVQEVTKQARASQHLISLQQGKEEERERIRKKVESLKEETKYGMETTYGDTKHPHPSVIYGKNEVVSCKKCHTPLGTSGEGVPTLDPNAACIETDSLGTSDEELVEEFEKRFGGFIATQGKRDKQDKDNEWFRTALKAARADERERVKKWADSNARTNDTMMTDLPENHGYTVDYYELLDFLANKEGDNNESLTNN